MRSIEDYLAKAAEFELLANEARLEALKKRYADLAECYQLLAVERQRLIAEGKLKPNQSGVD